MSGLLHFVASDEGAVLVEDTAGARRAPWDAGMADLYPDEVPLIVNAGPGPDGLTGFVCGGFGQFTEERSAVADLAVADAERVSGVRFQGKAISVVGDTPNDVRCAQHLNANTIAVATGRFDLSSLADHEPDHIFSELSDVPAVVRAIEQA